MKTPNRPANRVLRPAWRHDLGPNRRPRIGFAARNAETCVCDGAGLRNRLLGGCDKQQLPLRKLVSLDPRALKLCKE